GHLENPTICRSSSTLLQRLWHDRRIKPLSYGDTDVGSIALNEAFHPIDACTTDVGLRLAHRGRAVLHPLRALPEEPAEGLPGRPAVCRGDNGLTAFLPDPTPGRYS